MNLLFVEGGSRLIRDTEGSIYLSSNLHREILERYKRYCDNLTLLLRRSEKLYTPSDAEATSNKFDGTLAHIVDVPDIYRPRSNFFSMKLRKKVTRTIAAEIMKADRVIIRTAGNFYVDTAVKLCRKFRRTYMIESVELIFEMQWYNSLLGKISAPFAELRGKKYILQAPYVLYVTDKALQERYPSGGRTVGCSDVYAPAPDRSVLEKRLAGEDGGKHSIIFGTAAFMGTGVKGQEYVIRAISALRKEGITGIEYHLAGGGSPDKLVSLAESLGVKLKVYGSLPHDKIFEWYDHLDAYIQPSFQEGLCRSVIEAMSRGLPVACSTVGGNPELADMLFRVGNVRQIAAVMKEMLKPEVRKKEAVRSFTGAQDYTKEKLNAKRDEFFADFLKS